MNDDVLRELRTFVVRYPQATLADVMAEFDLSDTEAQAALIAIARMTGEVFTYYGRCPNGHEVAAAATVNLSASEMMRLAVCNYDGVLMIWTSAGDKSVYLPEFFAERLAESRKRLSEQKGVGDGQR